MKRKVIQICRLAPIGFLALALSGCFENDTDAVKALKDLRDKGTTEYVDKGRSQRFHTQDAYRIEVVPQQALQFEVGEQTEYKISAVLYFENSRIALRGGNLPQGAQINRSTNPEEENIWILSWQPQGGFVPSGKNVTNWPITLGIEVIDAGSAENEASIRGLTFESNFQLEVHRSGKAPEIVQAPELPAETKEGELVQLSFEALIPGTAAGDNVRVEFAPMNKSDIFNLGGYLSQTGSPEFLGDSRWRFQFALDFLNKRLPQPKSSAQVDDGLEGEAALRVIAPTGRQSEPLILKTHVAYNLPASVPELSWSQDTLAVKGGNGATLPLPLIATIPEGTGEVWFDAELMEKQLKQWPGEVNFTCGPEDGKKHKAKCSINWTPPCVSKEWKFVVHAHSRRGESGEMVVLEKNIRVNPDPVACQTGEAP